MMTETFIITTDLLGLIAAAVTLFPLERPMAEVTTETAEQRIHAMLDDAMSNGYDISTWTADDIVADLLAFADLRDDEDEAAIRPHVLTWKMKRSAL